MNLVHTLSQYSLDVHFNIAFPFMSVSQIISFFRLWGSNFYESLISPMPLHLCRYNVVIIIVSRDCSFSAHDGACREGKPAVIKSFFVRQRLYTCSTHIIFLDTITLIIFGEWYTLWGSLLWSFIQHPVTSFRFVVIFFSETYSQTPWSCVPHSV
jgi:predicted small integral membrane protein